MASWLPLERLEEYTHAEMDWPFDSDSSFPRSLFTHTRCFDERSGSICPRCGHGGGKSGAGRQG
jgi:hypothetical protein